MSLEQMMTLTPEAVAMWDAFLTWLTHPAIVVLALVVMYYIGHRNGVGTMFARKRELSPSEREQLRIRANHIELGRMIFRELSNLHSKNVKNPNVGMKSEEAYAYGSAIAKAIKLPSKALEDFKANIGYVEPEKPEEKQEPKKEEVSNKKEADKIAEIKARHAARRHAGKVAA